MSSNPNSSIHPATVSEPNISSPSRRSSDPDQPRPSSPSRRSDSAPPSVEFSFQRQYAFIHPPVVGPPPLSPPRPAPDTSQEQDPDTMEGVESPVYDAPLPPSPAHSGTYNSQVDTMEGRATASRPVYGPPSPPPQSHSFPNGFHVQRHDSMEGVAPTDSPPYGPPTPPTPPSPPRRPNPPPDAFDSFDSSSSFSPPDSPLPFASHEARDQAIDDEIRDAEVRMLEPVSPRSPMTQSRPPGRRCTHSWQRWSATSLSTSRAIRDHWRCRRCGDVSSRRRVRVTDLPEMRDGQTPPPPRYRSSRGSGSSSAVSPGRNQPRTAEDRSRDGDFGPVVSLMRLSERRGWLYVHRLRDIEPQMQRLVQAGGPPEEVERIERFVRHQADGLARTIQDLDVVGKTLRSLHARFLSDLVFTWASLRQMRESMGEPDTQDEQAAR